jgi:EpsI family protein
MLIRLSRILLPGVLLCVLGAYRVAFPPAQGAQSHLAELPKVLLGLSGSDVPEGRAILDDLESSDILIRDYRRPDGSPVWVVLIYFENTRLGGHDPQLCYRSQGFRTQDLPAMPIAGATQGLSAESFLASKSGRAERVATFWYAPGGRVLPDVEQYRGRLFLEGLRQNRTYGVFVRISTLESDRPGEAEEWNARFAAEIVRRLPGLIRE